MSTEVSVMMGKISRFSNGWGLDCWKVGNRLQRTIPGRANNMHKDLLTEEA